MCCCRLPSSSGKSPVNASATRSPPRRRRGCGWAETSRWAMTPTSALVINPAEAETVRRIFALYRELGCVRRVKEEADRLGLRTKSRTAANGTERGGKPFSRGHLYTLLSNPIYTGQIAHKGQLHPGQQPALIDDASWSIVRDQLAANTRNHRRRAKSAEPSLLAGLLVDARGERLMPSHAVNKGRRYRLLRLRCADH